jgi:TonB family protein
VEACVRIKASISLAALALLAPLSASAQVWHREPSAQDFAAKYPAAAKQAGLGGAAAIRCRAKSDGNLAGCVVVAEEPKGQGFGAAALGLAPLYQLTAPAAGQSIEGAVVTIPIRFGAGAGMPAYILNLRPGDAAALVTVLSGEPPRGAAVFPCASAADPQRRCLSHRFEWAAWPDAAATLWAIDAADQKAGISIVECAVGADGALTRCKVGGEASPKTQAALTDLAQRFRAPPATADGTPTAGRQVVIEVDWTILRAEPK